MASVGLPPPPINDAPGSFTWLEWYRQLRSYISTSGSVPWYVIDFAGSNITDIAVRLHNQLQGLQGGTTGEMYHLTAAQHASLGDGDHNDLGNIQGGTTTQRYHLDETQYNWVVAGGGGGGGGTPSDTIPLMDGIGSAGVSATYSRGDHRHPSDTSKAPLASPAFTGIPTVPTASLGTNTTQAASTAFVIANAVPGPTGPKGDTGDTGPEGPPGSTVASGVSFTPYGDIGSTNVQDAIQELDDEKVSKTGDSMTGPLVFVGAQLATATFAMTPDPGTPGSDYLDIDSPDGMILRAPYIILDTDNPILTMPGPQIGSRVVVAGIDAFGGANLGYESAPEPGYTVSDTQTSNVVIKVGGTAPPTAWIPLGLTVTLTKDIPANTATVMFDMLLTNPTNRSGVVEFGMNVNGTDVGRDITQQISANWNSTIAMSVPLLSAYSEGDVVSLVARVISNSNNGFALTMTATVDDPAIMRFFTPVSSGGSGSDVHGTYAGIVENDILLTMDYTITAGKNGMSAGPITIEDGTTITVPDGSTWTVV